jgi:hypothetical protein
LAKVIAGEDIEEPAPGVAEVVEFETPYWSEGDWKPAAK